MGKKQQATAQLHQAPTEHTTAPLSAASLEQSIRHHLTTSLARQLASATHHEWWLATCFAIRDHVLNRFICTQDLHHSQDIRRLYYLSMEYLTGRLLYSNLLNTGLLEPIRTALKALGKDLDSLLDEESDMGLGNGGLGRLAACFLDSLATLEYPSIGYGMHYEFGLFRQEICHGQQVEKPDNWLIFGNPWQIMRSENTQIIPLYGRVVDHFDEKGDWCPLWTDTQEILGIPWDIPIVGYGVQTVNFLRLWESRATDDFNLEEFNRGDYTEAVLGKIRGENISKVLYPNDSTENGKELRLIQQYFFVACSLRDILRRYKNAHKDIREFPQKAILHINDTHPSIAIPELMRILIDVEHLPWEQAWKITQQVFAYTNHTLMPEALECWGIALFQRVLPRHYQIICEINRRFLETDVERKWPGNSDKKWSLSLIRDGVVRMAPLAVLASQSINGVAAIHSRLICERLFPDFYALYPKRFNNKTNGITPRRWLQQCNPRLSDLISENIGVAWQRDLEELKALETLAEHKAFQESFMQVKQQNKEDLARVIQEQLGIIVDPTALFDVQIKRFHEYKRQHLNLLHVLGLYRRILHGTSPTTLPPRVVIFAGKAAPGYAVAKMIIHAINAVGTKINHCPHAKDWLKVVFLPNYNVSLAEKIIPAADLSEQISTAGTEASGTGNMKLALNGACTIGTLDGANIEILEAVHRDNIFIFGKTESEIEELRAQGYHPWEFCRQNKNLQELLDWMRSDYFALPDGQNPVKALAERILCGGDPFFVLADYADYGRAQSWVEQSFLDPKHWAIKAILNTARMGRFSSDRTIREYAEEIWHLPVVKIP
ncbi:MAG: glycogen/starch/alpha-glucan phosphorylase [Puniceicoccales bacterium]|jgi:starch phosphorylase|nr:glycogen/starch/alpha-glucan phosphorylase [Puniceicoccales bacterium]